MDLSLDDIIKKNKIGNSRQPRGRLQSGPSSRGNTKGNLRRPSQSNGKIVKGARRPLQSKDNARQQFSKQKKPGGGLVDARLKIIQKSRQRLTDARDKLSELAKQTDVRSKIKGGRKMAQRPDRRQHRTQGIRQRITTNPSLLQRSIRNNVSSMRDTSSLIRCTINRTDLQPYDDDDVEMMDIDSPIAIRTHNNLNNIKMVAQNNDYSNYRQDYSPNLTYLEHHYEQPVFRQFQNPRGQVQMAGRIGGRMSQEMRARLDTPVNSPLQYGFTQEQLSPPAVQGHRIVVSNLHSSVTHEDIKELFEDIGPLLTSRLVRPGTAEVIYKVQKDAKKAVEAYHNRQLDGQPMKCLLVNPRPPAVSSGVLRSNNMAPAPKFPVSSKSMVVPDISAIHKALFTSK